MCERTILGIIAHAALVLGAMVLTSHGLRLTTNVRLRPPHGLFPRPLNAEIEQVNRQYTVKQLTVPFLSTSNKRPGKPNNSVFPSP
jgi:hypothetical protein